MKREVGYEVSGERRCAAKPRWHGGKGAGRGAGMKTPTAPSRTAPN
jgi:hypothetical protein